MDRITVRMETVPMAARMHRTAAPTVTVLMVDRTAIPTVTAAMADRIHRAIIRIRMALRPTVTEIMEIMEITSTVRMPCRQRRIIPG